MRTSGFSGSVCNYIDMFLDNTGDPNTAAAVDQTENHAKHRKARQSIHPLPWGCISTARVAPDSPLPAPGGRASARRGRQGDGAGRARFLAVPGLALPCRHGFLGTHPIRAALLNVIPIFLSASRGNNVRGNNIKGNMQRG